MIDRLSVAVEAAEGIAALTAAVTVVGLAVAARAVLIWHILVQRQLDGLFTAVVIDHERYLITRGFVTDDVGDLLGLGDLFPVDGNDAVARAESCLGGIGAILYGGDINA